MINQENLDVFVHCTAGMGRAPALVLVYLCLFMPHKNYGFTETDLDLPGRVDAFVKSYRVVSVPNMRAVRNAFKEGQEKMRVIRN